MPDHITITGFVAMAPKALTTSEGLAITSFRLASNQRRFDRATEKWVDGDTNWYTVTAFRQLATNSAVSIHRGDRVVVTGKVRLRDWESNGKKGITIEIDAEAIGHDLAWGTAAFSRNTGSLSVSAAGDALAHAADHSGWAPAPDEPGQDQSGPDESGQNQSAQHESGPGESAPDSSELVGASTGSADIETPF